MYSNWWEIFIFIQIITNVYSFNFSDNENMWLNMNCVTSMGKSGLCKKINECPIGKVTLTMENICYFEQNDPIVCCESTSSNYPILTTTVPNYDDLQMPIYEGTGNRYNLPVDLSTATQNIIYRPELPLIRATTTTTTATPNHRNPLPLIRTTTFNPLPSNDRQNKKLQIIVKNRCYEYQGMNDYWKYSPQIVTIGWKSSDGKIIWKCGGYLISENFIITVAHCVYDKGLPADVVRIGNSNLFENPNPNQSKNNDITQEHNITEIYVHQNYKNGLIYDDIALMKISQNVTFNSHIKPACLWTENFIPGNNVISIGYNQENHGLLVSNLTLIENEKCNVNLGSTLSLPNGIQESQICAVNSNPDAPICQSISGGPLIYKKETGVYFGQQIIGVSSFGESCSNSKPIVFTKVASYIDWIVPIVWPNEAARLI